MKWLPIILALVFFKLTVLPTCATDVSCCTDTEESTSIPDSDETKDDCCSDCSCLHSTYTSVLADFTLSLDHPDTTPRQFSLDNLETYHHLYVSQAWHPPLYS